jgi:hypothetical protein
MLMPDNITVTNHNGIRMVEGFNHNGEKVIIETIISNNTPWKILGLGSEICLAVTNFLLQKEKR